MGKLVTAVTHQVRGIVELEVLRAIEKELPANIPIKRFFDLLVGTRYVCNPCLGATESESLGQSPSRTTLVSIKFQYISKFDVQKR